MITVLVDMDEVLADFAAGALWTHGWTKERFYRVHPKGQWYMHPTMKLTLQQFCAPMVAQGEDFWFGLSPLPWMPQVLNVLLSKFPPDRLLVISSPLATGDSGTCYLGKRRWLNHHIGNWLPLVVTSDKPAWANPKMLLIDDRDTTVRQFVAKGGQGIVFPTRHNRLHGMSLNPRYPVIYLQEQLDGIQIPQR